MLRAGKGAEDHAVSAAKDESRKGPGIPNLGEHEEVVGSIHVHVGELEHAPVTSLPPFPGAELTGDGHRDVVLGIR